jgi:hypothetical protein
MTKQQTVDSPVVGFPTSCLGEGGRIPPMTEEERRRRNEALIETLSVMAEVPDEDPPGSFDELVRGINDGRPHRPIPKGIY